MCESHRHPLGGSNPLRGSPDASEGSSLRSSYYLSVASGYISCEDLTAAFTFSGILSSSKNKMVKNG